MTVRLTEDPALHAFLDEVEDVAGDDPEAALAMLDEASPEWQDDPELLYFRGDLLWTLEGPEAAEPWLSLLPSAPGWTCWLAFAGDEPAATGALYVEGDAAYLGFGATLPEHRGRGGQNALLAARIEHARAAGCRRLATETGERREGLPSNSYRNLLRFGFRERHVVRHWVRPSR